MPTSNARKSAALRIAGLFMLLIVPGAAVAGMQSQGMQAQGMQSQGMQSQGMQSQGMQSQGMQSQGMQSQGMQSQGMQSQGMQSQGMQAQGMQSQGMQSQGVAVIGNDAAIAELKGVEITFVEMKGTSSTSEVESHVLTNIPNMSSGPGNYISVGGGSAVGHYAVAHLRDAGGAPAEDLDLFIAGEQKDPMPNLFHRAEEQDNQDELYVVYFFQKCDRPVAVAVPVQPRHGQRVGNRDPGGAPPIRTSSSSRARDRCRVEVRAQLGLSALGVDAGVGVQARGPTAGRWRHASSRTTTPRACRRRWPRIARTATATRRTARWSTCSTHARSSGPTRSRTRSTRRTRYHCG